MRRALAIAFVFLGVGAVVVIFEKYFVFAFLRLTDRSNVGETVLATTPVRETLIVSFGEGTSTSNPPSRSPAGSDSTFEERRQHTVQFLGLTSRPLTFKSETTLVDYRNGLVEYVTAYLVRDAVSYERAVQSVSEVVRDLELATQLDLAGYERNLDLLPDPETHIPRAGWRPYDLGVLLNCGWSREKSAAQEVDSVQCRPYLFVDRAVPEGQ